MRMNDSTNMRVMEQIEDLIGRNVGRDIARMKAFAKGGVERAARSIMETPKPHVGIVTGFFIRHAEPPSPETDGLGGTAHLAAGLLNAGISVTLISDAPCAKAVWALSTAIPGAVDLEIVSIRSDAVYKLRDRLTQASQPLTHLIAIERVAPGSDGKPHREHGWDMTAETAPLDLLFDDEGWSPPWTTIGIGDGGNEIGMGVLPPEIVANDIPNGGLIAAKTRADHLIVAGVSNWGAYGLLAAMAALRPDRAAALLAHFTPDMDRRFLEAAVVVGQAVDDSRPDRPGKPQMSVDRLPVERHAEVINALRSIVIK
ncbi:glutamate cyclase domain-containing protein [Acidocella sp.]|jgi:hypothetical protein|uniref:glutamate cyclase domain-containing protein n=1 Tax=Acidocella sp. TaxID=50710 RepID=UPI002F3F992D